MGKGVEQNYFTGIRWFRKAAAQGHVEAQVRLGVAYADNIHFKPDYALAMDCFRKAAEQGNPSAQYFLGDLYNMRSMYNIKSGKEDRVEAFKWYQKAAEQGHPQGQLRLGLMYDRGLGVETNHIEALKLLRKAAEQGLPRAQEFLGHAYWYGGVETNVVEACAWLKLSVDEKHFSLESESVTPHPLDILKPPTTANQLGVLKRSMTPQELEQAEKRAAQLRTQIRPSQAPTYGLEDMLFAD